jgi:hypothetical protein
MPMDQATHRHTMAQNVVNEANRNARSLHSGDVINLLRRWRHISPNGSQGFIRSLHILAEIKGVSLGLDP